MSQLGYWAIRGLAQPIRLLLNYVEEEFEDVKYQVGEGPEFNKEAWFSVKYSLGLDFPNLPYYIDGDIKLTQTNTILRHLARKHNLYGETEKEKAHVDMLLDQIMDLRNEFVSLCYGRGFESNKDVYVQQARLKIELLERYLGNKPFFVGEKVTVCDFHIYEMLDQHNIFEPKLLAERPKLLEYMKRFQELPTIKAYMASDRFLTRPINNKYASFY